MTNLCQALPDAPPFFNRLLLLPGLLVMAGLNLGKDPLLILMLGLQPFNFLQRA